MSSPPIVRTPSITRSFPTMSCPTLRIRAVIRSSFSKPLVNDERMTALMRSVGQDIVGKERVIDGVRTMGGEDMPAYLPKVPGAFAFGGSAPPAGKGAPHHSPTFDIDEESLTIGAELLTRTVVRYLETAG